MLQIGAYIVFTIIILIIAKKYLEIKGHPKALFYLFFAEMWERFSFYGMRALLMLYLVADFMRDLDNKEEVSYGIFAAYGALVYLTPLIGGYIADNFIGYRKAIMFGGILMALGHFFMAFPTDFFFYGALGLLIMGNGFFKPNISTLVGSLYEEEDPRRDSGFTVFYMGINLGAMIAPLFCGYLGEVYGWHYGFGAAGVGMLAGIIVFWKGIKDGVLLDKGLQPVKYIEKKVVGMRIDNFVYLLGIIAVPIFAYLILLESQSPILGNVLLVVGAAVLCYVIYLIYDFKINQKDAVSGDRLIAIMILVVFLTVFWACFEQAGSSVTIWVDKCVRLVGINAAQSNAINPGYIVLLAIPFSWLWTRLGSLNRNPSTPIKFGLGILQLGLGFLIFACSIHFVGDDGKVPLILVFLGYLLITTGELFLSPIGLSKVTQLAPKKIVAFMMGVWFLSSTFAHYISGGIAKLTAEEYYQEGSLFTIQESPTKYTQYVLHTDDDGNIAFNMNKEIKGIEKLTGNKESDKIEGEEYQNINSQVIMELLESKENFKWEINKFDEITLKYEDGHEIPDKIIEIHNEWEKETSEITKLNSVITGWYYTNESLEGNNDAIAGITWNSDDVIESGWANIEDPEEWNKSNLSPKKYNFNITTDQNLKTSFTFDVQQGPSDILSKQAFNFLGNPKIGNKSMATLFQYINIYAKIGFITIIISLFVLIISPFIRKLMHGVH